MLRIHRTKKDGMTWLTFEGKLVGDWVEEGRVACAQEIAAGRPPVLDLSQVTYVDRDGLRLLRQWIANGVPMPVRSSFVAELLRAKSAE